MEAKQLELKPFLDLPLVSDLHLLWAWTKQLMTWTYLKNIKEAAAKLRSMYDTLVNTWAEYPSYPSSRTKYFIYGSHLGLSEEAERRLAAVYRW
jgi:hypothetical protein